MQKIVPKGGPAYQVPLAEFVKKSVGDKVMVSAVGAITNGKLAEEILQQVSITLRPSFRSQI